MHCNLVHASEMYSFSADGQTKALRRRYHLSNEKSDMK